MPAATADLLQQFAAQLQEWEQQVAAGVAAVATLQSSLGELHPSQPAQETTDVLNRLLQLAPSFRLEQYIQQQQKPPVTASDAASRIHAAVNTLRAAVDTQQQLLAALSQTCHQHQEAVLSQQLSGSSLQPQTAGAAAAAGVGQDDPAAAAGGADSPLATDANESAAAVRAPAVDELQPEELALLMHAVVAGLQQDLQWMASAAGGISLDSSPEQLGTLATFWQLQPFTHEAAVDAITRAAAAAASAVKEAVSP